MKKLKKTFVIIALSISILILLTNQAVFASSIADMIQSVEYSEEFQEWLELSDEEKENVLQPRMYDILTTQTTSKSLLRRARATASSIKSIFSLKELIASNLSIRNQQQTGSCWTFATLSSLETNLALSNYYKGINLAKVYDYSERHMEYATSRVFANNEINTWGYNRSVGDGGTWNLAESYLTNGTGAIPESEMEFENNEDTINLSEIQNKTVSSQVYDTVYFANYNKQTDDTKTEIMNQIKQHIQNYGSVYAGLHGNSSTTDGYSCYNNDTGAKYCDNTTSHSYNHAVSIIGWDDNYSTENFANASRPTSNGAWIVRNSWGEDYGDNGFIYVSYEDCNIATDLWGIVKATDTVNYDNIYQYDEYYPSDVILVSNVSNIMLCNIFEKQTTGTEYLTQVALNTLETYTCKVYINPNGTSMAESDLQLVTLKAGESETINAGYHTLEFATPIEIKGDNFVVVIAIQGTNSNKITMQLESKLENLREEYGYEWKMFLDIRQ
jgi:C1A family cysteine protease